MTNTYSTATARALFDQMNVAGIAYCHWKSNAHLEAGLAGMTDMDVLVDEHDHAALQEILWRSGFKRFPTHPSRSYPGREDYFGVDEVSGRLLHLDLQYRLIIGQRHLKTYHLPWEFEMLSTRQLDDARSVYVAEPTVEMLTLIVRAAMKIRWRDRAVGLVRKGRPPDNLLREYRWLSDLVDLSEVTELGSRLIGEEASLYIQSCMASDFSFSSLVRLRRSLTPVFANYRSHGLLVGLWVRWTHELRWLVGGVNRRFFRAPFSYSRGGSTGGVMICLIGSDGSGKSTLARELAQWLSPKFDLVSFYFGSGGGPASGLRWPLIAARRVLGGQRKAGSSSSPEGKVRHVSPALAIWALALAREKRLKLRKASRARSRGLLVICDRYPQAEIPGIADGPLLTGWVESPSKWRRAVARWEERAYRATEFAKPDYVVRLLVSSEVAQSRKPDHDPQDLAIRTEIARKLQFPSLKTEVIDIDANQEKEDVLLEVKRRIWPGL